MKALQERIERGQAQHGTQFDSGALQAVDHAVLVAYDRKLRVKVTTTYDGGETYTRTGTVGSTTGWRPAWLLMHRSNAIGSSDVLGPDDRVVAYWDGRRYVDWK